MTGKAGANLFTINFSSSSYYEEDEEEKKQPIKPPPPVKKPPITKFTPTRITKQNIAESPIGIELSDSSYYSYDEYSQDEKNIKTKQKTVELNEDVFSIDAPESNAELQPTRIMKQTGNYQMTMSNNKPQNKNNENQIPQPVSQENIVNNNNNNSNNISNNNDNNTEIENHNSNTIESTNNISESIQENKSNQNQSTLQNNLPATPSPSKAPMAPSSWPIYLITREKKMQINGRRILFSFLEDSKHVYSAKCKGKNPQHVYIKRGDNPDKIDNGDTADAIIMIGNEGTDFSLRKSSNSSNEIMTIRITPARTSADTARKMSVIFFEPRDGAPARLMSKNPCLNPDGKPEHDFEGRFAIESVKNAVLVDKTKGPSLMFIRKTGKMAIEIEVRFEHEDLWIFAIGIASFLSKVK